MLLGHEGGDLRAGRDEGKREKHDSEGSSHSISKIPWSGPSSQLRPAGSAGRAEEGKDPGEKEEDGSKEALQYGGTEDECSEDGSDVSDEEEKDESGHVVGPTPALVVDEEGEAQLALDAVAERVSGAR